MNDQAGDFASAVLADTEEVWSQLQEGFRFVPGDFSDDVAFDQLRETITDLDHVRGTGGSGVGSRSTTKEA